MAGGQGSRDLRDVAAVCIKREVTEVVLLSATVVVLSGGSQKGSRSHLGVGAVIDGRVDDSSLNWIMDSQLLESILDGAADRHSHGAVDLEIEDLVDNGVGDIVVAGDGLVAVVGAGGLYLSSLSVWILFSSSLTWLSSTRQRYKREGGEVKTDSSNKQHTHEGRQRKAEEVHCDRETARTFVLWFLLMDASCEVFIRRCKGLLEYCRLW